MTLDTITASEEGGKRRRAEFVILEILRENGPMNLEELEGFVKEIHDTLLDGEVNSPFYYRGGGSNGPISREFDSSIDRLLQYGRIKHVDQSKYDISERGEDYLADENKLERHNIGNDFQTNILDQVRGG